MSNNLNKITPNMEFGYTSYIPSDETRNFIALSPGNDDLTQRLETKPTAIEFPDSEAHTESEVNKFTENIQSNPLPAINYRKLAWGGYNPSLEDLDTAQPLTGKSSKRPVRRSNTSDVKAFNYSDLPQLEAYYRGSSATAFRIDPGACHLIDQSAAVAQDRKLRSRLGNSVILLNDPVYADWLRGMVRNEMEEQEQARCLHRSEQEFIRDKRARKMGRFAVDELFEAMNLPEICDKKPWLIKPNYGRWSMATDNARKSDSKHSVQSIPRHHANDGRLILPPIHTPPRSASLPTEDQPAEELKLPSLHKDRLSEVDNITAMFEKADNILQSPDEYSKYRIKQSNNSGEAS